MLILHVITLQFRYILPIHLYDFVFIYTRWTKRYIDGLVQKWRNSRAFVMELRLFCI